MKYAFIIYAAVNIFAFFLAWYDKICAVYDFWRVSEKALFITALLGGAPGEYISMIIFRHKTKHLRFMIGLPLIIVLQAAVIAFVYMRLHNR